MQLNAADPLFVSVTYGAGGSDRQRSFDAIRTVADTGAVVAGHLTCVGQSVGDVDVGARPLPRARREQRRRPARRPARRGRCRILAPPLRLPDAPLNSWQPSKARGTFDVSVSAYPERHPQSPSIEHDLDVLAEKLAAGADRAITQMFFDNELFLRYRDRARPTRHRGCARAGCVPDPLVPGGRPLRRPVRGRRSRAASPNDSPARRRPDAPPTTSPPTSPPSRSPGSPPTASSTSTCTRSTAPSWCSPCASASASSIRSRT